MALWFVDNENKLDLNFWDAINSVATPSRERDELAVIADYRTRPARRSPVGEWVPDGFDGKRP